MCEGDGGVKKSTLSLKTKLLFLIERGLSSREILSALAIAKTNLAALTKELASEGLIEKTRDARDRREKGTLSHRKASDVYA
ncbi:MAG: MarR family transcriptional regulator [Christensenellales bacterium]